MAPNQSFDMQSDIDRVAKAIAPKRYSPEEAEAQADAFAQWRSAREAQRIKIEEAERWQRQMTPTKIDMFGRKIPGTERPPELVGPPKTPTVEEDYQAWQDEVVTPQEIISRASLARELGRKYGWDYEKEFRKALELPDIPEPRTFVGEAATAAVRGAVGMNTSSARLVGGVIETFGDKIPGVDPIHGRMLRMAADLADALAPAPSTPREDAGVFSRAAYGGANIVGETTPALAQMIGLTAALGPLGLLWAAGAGAAPMAVDAAGKQYKRAMEVKGMTPGRALASAMMAGAATELVGAGQVGVYASRMPWFAKYLTEHFPQWAVKPAHLAGDLAANAALGAGQSVVSDVIQSEVAGDKDAFVGAGDRMLASAAGGALIPLGFHGAARLARGGPLNLREVVRAAQDAADREATRKAISTEKMYAPLRREMAQAQFDLGMMLRGENEPARMTEADLVSGAEASASETAQSESLAAMDKLTSEDVAAANKKPAGFRPKGHEGRTPKEIGFEYGRHGRSLDFSYENAAMQRALESGHKDGLKKYVPKPGESPEFVAQPSKSPTDPESEGYTPARGLLAQRALERPTETVAEDVPGVVTKGAERPEPAGSQERADAAVAGLPKERVSRASVHDRPMVVGTVVSSSMPSSARLNAEAAAGDVSAAERLNVRTRRAFDRASAAAGLAPAEGRAVTVYFGGEQERSVQFFVDGSNEQALAAAAKFGRDNGQAEVHILGSPDEGTQPGHVYPDGSYNTFQHVIPYDKTPSLAEINKAIGDSGLYGASFGEDAASLYYVGDPNDTAAVTEWSRGVAKLEESLGVPRENVQVEVRRLFRLGSKDEPGVIHYARHEPADDGSSVVAGYEDRQDIQEKAREIAGRDVQIPRQPKELAEDDAKLLGRVAAAYEGLADNNLADPVVRTAYEHLADVVREQYDIALGDVRVELAEPGSKEPYKNSDAMRRDVLRNNHLYVLPTTPETFGPAGVKYDDHPLLRDSGLKDVNGKPMLVNDVFRAVHDYVGHVMTGSQFGAKGDLAAAKAHGVLTSDPYARAALLTETLGQNAWVNFGPEAEWNRTHKGETRFARQKVDLLPTELLKVGDPVVDATLSDLSGEVPVRPHADEFDEAPMEAGMVFVEKAIKSPETVKAPKDTDASGRRVLSAIARRIEELAARENARFRAVPLNERTDKQIVDYLIKTLMAEFKFHKTNSPDYVGFYDQHISDEANPKLQKWAQAKFGRELTNEEVQLFHILSSFGSPNANPSFDSSVGLFLLERYLKTGELSAAGIKPKTVFKQGKPGTEQRIDTGILSLDDSGKPRMAKISPGYDDTGLARFKALVDRRGLKGAIDWLTSTHPAEEIIAEVGKPTNESEYFSAKTQSKKGSDEGGEFFGVFGIAGPKLGSYILNRLGHFSTVTKDLWYARTLARVTGAPLIDHVGQPIRTPWTLSRDGIRMRKLADQAFRKIAEQEKTTPADVQQRLWDLEKRLWETYGATRESSTIAQGIEHGAANAAQREAAAKENMRAAEEHVAAGKSGEPFKAPVKPSTPTKTRGAAEEAGFPERGIKELRQGIRRVADKADESLGNDAQAAVSGFVGHGVKGRDAEESLRIPIMRAGALEDAYSSSPSAAGVKIKEDMASAFAPVKEWLRSQFGESVRLYRHQKKIPFGERRRNVLSWSFDPRVADSFAGADKDLRVLTDSEIAAKQSEYDSVGEVSVGRYIIRKGKDGDAELYKKADDYGDESFESHLGSDPKEVIRYLKSENEYALERNSENAKKRSGVIARDVPIDDIVWVTDRANQVEAIVLNRPDDVAGFPARQAGPVATPPLAQSPQIDPIDPFSDQLVATGGSARRPWEEMARKRKANMPKEIEAQLKALEAAKAEGRTIAQAPVDMVSDLFNAMGLGPAVVGKIGRMDSATMLRALYRFANQDVRVGRQDDVVAAVHELGHYLHATLFPTIKETKIFGKNNLPTVFPKRWLSELEAGGRALYGTDKPKVGYEAEGWAEFVRYYMTDPIKAKAQFPTVEQDVSNMLVLSHPLADAAINRFRLQYEMLQKTPMAQRYISGNTSIRNWSFRDRADWWIYNVSDDLVRLLTMKRDLGAEDANLPDAERLFRLLSTHANAITWKVMHRGIFKPGDPSKTVIGPSFVGDVVNKVQGKEDLFGQYLLSRRLLEMHNRAGGKMQIKDAAAWAADEARLARDHPEFVDAAANLKKISDWAIDLLEHYEYVSPEEAANLKSHDAYVPLVEASTLDKAAGGRFKNARGTAPIKRAFGHEGASIVDPLTSFAIYLDRVAYAALENEARSALAGWILKLPEGGRWGSETTGPLTKREVGPEVVQDAIWKALDAVPSGSLSGKQWGEIGKAIAGADGIELWERSAKRDPNQLEYRVGGERKYIDMKDSSGLLQKAVEEMGIAQADWIVRMASAHLRLLRFGATGGNPSFGIPNFLSDFMSALVMTNANYKDSPGHFSARVRGIAEAIKKGDMYEVFRYSGGDQSVPSIDQFITKRGSEKGKVNWKDLSGSDKNTLQALAGGDFGGATKRIASLRTLVEINDAIERANRLGEFMASLHSQGNGIAPDSVSTAAWDAKDLLDYTRRGHKIRKIGAAVPFLGTGIQATEKFVRFVKKDPVRAALRTLSFTATLSAASMASVRADPKYWQQSNEERRKYWYFPAPGEGFIKIKKPYQIAILSNALEGFFAMGWGIDPRTGKVGQESDVAFQGYAKHVSDTLLPSFNAFGLQPILETALGKQGYSWYWSKEIVPDSDAALEPEFRGAQNATLMARMIGRLANVSPAKVDYLVRGMTGGLGADVSRWGVSPVLKLLGGEAVATPGGTAATDPMMLPVVRSFMTRSYIGNQATVGAFFDDFEHYSEISATAKRLESINKDTAKAYKADHKDELKMAEALSSEKQKLAKIFEKKRANLAALANGEIDADEARKRTKEFDDKITERIHRFYGRFEQRGKKEQDE